MSKEEHNKISATRTEGKDSQRPQAHRGSAQDYEQFGEREVSTTAHDLPTEKSGTGFGGSRGERDASGWPTGI